MIQGQDFNKIIKREIESLSRNTMRKMSKMICKDVSDEEFVDNVEEDIANFISLNLWRSAAVARSCAVKIRFMLESNDVNEDKVSGVYTVMKDHVDFYNDILSKTTGNIIGVKGSAMDYVDVEDVLEAARRN